MAPRSFFSLTKVDCNKDTCRTFGSLFTNGSDLCETLWDGSFMYEPNEEDAYSMAWSPNKTGGINPNSLVNAYVTFPDTCPGAKIDLVCGDGGVFAGAETGEVLWGEGVCYHLCVLFSWLYICVQMYI